MIKFGTKAETLEQFASLVKLSSVPAFFYFSAEQWKEKRAELLSQIKARFGDVRMAIRSSAYNEDSATASLAGAHESLLNVDGRDEQAVVHAIESVLRSYESGNPLDQVLVQHMLENVVMSGVMTTHDLVSGAPYYIINYDDESGKTDRITGGIGVNKTIVIHHNTADSYISSQRIEKLIKMVHELERLCSGREALDVEFAQTRDGVLHLLQVRRIVVQKNWNRAVKTRISEALENIEQFFAEYTKSRIGLAGNTTILGQMPDWNPAELLGSQPGALATALFRETVSDTVWHKAREVMGYRRLQNESLMVTLAGRPYIDVRKSFNSFLPAGLPAAVENAIVDAWLHRLSEHPEYHDKVEFQVAMTVFDFMFEKNFSAWYSNVLNEADRNTYFDAIRQLTARNLSLNEDATLPAAMRKVQILAEKQKSSERTHVSPLREAFYLLSECREYGSLPFSTIARHAFMAESMLRAAVARGAWTAGRMNEFKHSFSTVTGELGADFARVLKNQLSTQSFMARYGHLRPGTFDICSLRYDQREDMFRDSLLPKESDHHESHEFRLTEQEECDFAGLLKECRLPISVGELLKYAQTAICGREYAKFVFSRHLSDAIECIAEWGEHIGLSRDDLSYLTLADMADALINPVTCDQETYFRSLASSRMTTVRQLRGMRLGFIIRDVRDLYVVPMHRGAPNFVTTRTVEANIELLDNHSSAQIDLFGKIACIESADPGYDWIFTKGIAGLVTRFGGSNSHMTIRCAELGIPAAIGVGEQTFDHLCSAHRIELRCGESIVRPVYG